MMDNFEVSNALKTFRIIVDTREQSTKKALERYDSFGVPYERATLNFGDYCGQITLPEGDLYDQSLRISPKCVVERKMSIDELAMCLGKQRDRFRREFERASNNDSKVWLLVEGASWEAIENHRYRSMMRPNALIGSIVAWMTRYDASLIFCKAGTSGRMIKEVLYRDMKERLERGEFG